MTDFNGYDRRTFLRRDAMGAGAFWALSLSMMAEDVRCPNMHDGMAVVDAQGNSGV